MGVCFFGGCFFFTVRELEASVASSFEAFLVDVFLLLDFLSDNSVDSVFFVIDEMLDCVLPFFLFGFRVICGVSSIFSPVRLGPSLGNPEEAEDGFFGDFFLATEEPLPVFAISAFYCTLEERFTLACLRSSFFYLRACVRCLEVEFGC